MRETMVWVVFGLLVSSVFVMHSWFQSLETQLAQIRRRLNAIAAHLNVGPEPAIPPEVLGLLQAGRKIDAIKVYRQATGAGLAEAKKAVEQLQAEAGLAAGKIIQP